MRFLDKTDGCLEVREECDGFKYAECVKGIAVSNIIIDFFADMNLIIQNHEHSAMVEVLTCREKYNGVHARILQLPTFTVKPSH